MKYGYARVSTDGQSLDAQETASGARADRAQLRRTIDQPRLDRLARSTRDLLNTLATITSKGAGDLGPLPSSHSGISTVN